MSEKNKAGSPATPPKAPPTETDIAINGTTSVIRCEFTGPHGKHISWELEVQLNEDAPNTVRTQMDSSDCAELLFQHIHGN